MTSHPLTTHAVTFTSKIRNLRDYHYSVSNNLTPQPTGVDIANTLKYFSQTLLSILKDVPNIPAESYGPRQRDSVRLSVFPNNNYAGLYKAALNMIDLVPIIQIGQLELGEAVLNVLGCLVPFLENDLLDSLPYTVASTLAIFPPTLHKDTIDLLCSNLLPMTLGFEGCSEPTYASESAAAIITMVFQHTDNGSYHSQILECLMSLKKDIIKDILSIIAYGPPSARAPAANLLFYYWPQLNPSLSDRRGIHYKYSAWPPVLCQREDCVNSGKCQAVKMCLNPSLAIQSRDKPPPLYICSDCAEVLKKEHSDYMMDILLPMSHVSQKCENKNCKSVRNNTAISTCFSIECASVNGNRPIRYCQSCNKDRHGNKQGEGHVYHQSIELIWSCTPEMQRYLMDAIIALLKEAQPLESKRTVEMGEEHRHHHMGDDDALFEVEEAGERKMLSRYGIWLLVELCTPREDIPIEILGRLLGMLFQWFDATAYLPDDNVGNALERLKPEYICKWLREVNKTHFEVVVSCLLPHPVEYARVGGFWDTLATRTTQIKEGLNCFFCLVPYDIISYQIWDYVIPYWMEAIRTEVPTEDLHLLKVLLSKAFDIDMCPLPFMLDKMYHFVEVRFADASAYVQEQALQWLQILSGLEIVFPLHTLFSMFRLGVRHLQMIEIDQEASGPEPSNLARASPTGDIPPPLSPNKDDPMVVESFEIYDRETEIILPCYIMMLDLTLKQLELQESPRHLGIYNETSKELMSLLTMMLSKHWDGTHTCMEEKETVNCQFCQNVALWQQLASSVMQLFSPRDPCKIPNKDIPRVEDLQGSVATSKDSSSSGETRDVAGSLEIPDVSYDTSQMPVHLQLFNALVQEFTSLKDIDALHSLLLSMNYLILHGECLNYSVNQYPEFLKFSLARKLLPNLWHQLQAKHSQVAFECVPLLLHCLTLPTGADMLWKIVEENFGSDDWKERFAAVEKATVLARFMESDSVMHNKTIKTAFAHIFCLLLGSLEDINAAVSQRTIQYLETIKASSIKCICQCLEFQFDAVISDRAMILHNMHLLSNILPDHSILTWEFFLARFDSLSLEAQIDLESTGDLSYPTDLTSSDRESEHFLRKLNRARFALARTDSIRSVSKSLGGKPPYRRAVSVPIHLLTKSPIKDKDKEKACVRQQSAPQFRLNRQGTSKFNLGNLTNSVFQGGYLKEFTDEESNFAALLQRAMDLEGVDRETVHQLVALLMKFMIKCEQQNIHDDDQKAENIVLRHLNVLLGYNQSEKSFSVPPYKLRTSAVFNSYLSGVSYVLDRNFELGNKILPITLLLLQYGPSPQRYASDYQPPNYTLWYLEPHTRISWLHTLMVILYKYQISTSPVSAIVQTLVRIVVNTIEAQHHHCKIVPDDVMPPASPNLPRGKDSTKISVNDLENILETETPPQSPPPVNEDVFIEMVRETGTTTVKYQKGAHEDSSKDGSSSTEKESSKPGSRKVSPASVQHVSETPVRKTKQRKQQPPRKLVHYLENETEDSSDQQSETQGAAGLEVERPVSVDKKMVEQLEEFELHVEGKPDIGAQTALRHVSSHQQDVLSSKEGTSVSETSKDGLMSEDPESAEESEKTQTTSDADSVSESRKNSVKETRKASSPRTKGGIKPNFRQRKSRKTGLSTIELQKKFPELASDSPDTDKSTKSEGRRMRKTDLLSKPPAKKPLPNRHSENAMVERCQDCSTVLEQYDDEIIGLSVVVLATYIHREPSLATPMLLESLIAVARIASSSPYAWQMEANVVVPGNSLSIARQFLRCCLHQLAPNGIFPMLFQSSFDDNQFLKTMAAALVDFTELPCHAAIHFLLEGLNNMRTLSTDNIQLLLDNLATYMHSISLETSATMWANILNQFDVFFRRLSDILPVPCDMTSVLKIITCLLKVSGINNAKANKADPGQSAPTGQDLSDQGLQMLLKWHILEPFSKLLCIAVTSCSFHLHQVLDICSLCNRVFNRERDKLYLTRTVIFQLVQALKYKASLPDENFLLLVQIFHRVWRSSRPPQVIIILKHKLLVRLQAIRSVTGTMTQKCQKRRKIGDDEALAHLSERTEAEKFQVSFIDTYIGNGVFAKQNIRAVDLLMEYSGKLLHGAPDQDTSYVYYFPRGCNTCIDATDNACMARMVNDIDNATKANCKMKKVAVHGDPCLALYALKDIEKGAALRYDYGDGKAPWRKGKFVVLDAGGTIGSSNIILDIGSLYHTHAHTLMSTYAAECMRQYLSDCVEFISDLHTITKVKANMKSGCNSMNEDTLGSLIKSGVAQYVALEITRGNGRDNRAIARYLPWLYHPPSTTQQGPKEFTDCIGHIRLMSWLLIGTLTHTAMTEGAACITCMPFPLDASTFIAEHVLVIMTGFAEQSNSSVLNMSSLFHAFFLCQLWTMYCESTAAMYNSNSEQHLIASSMVMDFWARVTPGILQLLSHSKVLAEMVNLHFLSLMEALQECNSSVLAKLFPMWTSILYAYHGQLPGHLQVRLQAVQNWQPPAPSTEQTCINSNILLTWLKRIQFKLGQIEVQSSAATQFYSV